MSERPARDKARRDSRRDSEEVGSEGAGVRGGARMALPCLSALSVRVPVPVGAITNEEQSEIHDLSHRLRFSNKSRDVTIGYVKALLALVEKGGYEAKNEVMKLWQRDTMTSIVPMLLDLLCDGSKEALQLLASLRDMDDYLDNSLDTMDTMIHRARTDSLVPWPGRPVRDPVPSLMDFLFGDDDDAAQMAAGILDGMDQEDAGEPSAVLLQMVALGLVEKTVKMWKDISEERREGLVGFIMGVSKVSLLMEFLFGDDDDAAQAAAAILSRMSDNDTSFPSTFRSQMLEDHLVKKTVEALSEKISNMRRAQLLLLLVECCRDGLNWDVHNSMVEANGYELLFRYLASDQEDHRPFTHAFNALDELLKVYVPQTLDEAALFVQPLVADKVWKPDATTVEEQRYSILTYLHKLANRSHECAHGIARHTSFIERLLNYGDDASDLLNELETLDVPWLQLYIGLGRHYGCRRLQMIVPTEQALLGAIGENGRLYSAIQDYNQFKSDRLQRFEAQGIKLMETNNVTDLATYGTCLFSVVFNAKPDEMREAAARAKRHPDPGCIKFLLDKYMKDLRETNVPTSDDVILRQKKEAEEGSNESTPVRKLLTKAQKEKLERYKEYMAFVEGILNHRDFPSIRDFETKPGGDNEPSQTLADYLKALFDEIERPLHADKEKTDEKKIWTLWHVVRSYNDLDAFDKFVGEWNAARSKRARISAAALRAALAAHVGAARVGAATRV